MSTYLDLAAGNAALKEYYTGQVVENLVYRKNPLLALVPKNENSTGKYHPVPIQYEVNQGRSATFTTAQANQTSPKFAEFLVTRKSDYDIATVDNQALEASASDSGAFLSFATNLVNGAIRGATLSAASGIFRSGTGKIGTISGSPSTGVITLTNPADVVQFGVGQVLQANATDGGTPRAALGYVIKRSISAGTITVSATGQGGAAGNPSAWADADSLLVQGDNNAKPSGLQAWLPMTDPAAGENFYGVDRSTDYRLYGIQYDGTGQPIEEALIDHCLLLAREGADPRHCITNFGSYAALLKALGARRQYEDIKGPAGISFRSITIDGPDGPIAVLPDRNCPVARAFNVQMDTWKLISIGSVPKVLQYSEREQMLRVYNADASECRVGMYYNLTCNAPGWNGQLSLAQ